MNKTDWQQAVQELDVALAAAAASGTVSEYVARRMYSEVIHITRMASRWREALDVLARMKKDGVEPDHYCVTAVSQACARAGRWSEAFELLQTMMRDMRPVPLHAYQLASKVCTDAGKWQESLDVLDGMREAGLPISQMTYSATIRCCGKALQIAEVNRLYDELRELEEPVEQIAYTTVMTAYAQAGRWRRALEVMAEMKRQGITCDVVTYTSAIRYLRYPDIFSAFSPFLSSVFVPRRPYSRAQSQTSKTKKKKSSRYCSWKCSCYCG